MKDDLRKDLFLAVVERLGAGFRKQDITGPSRERALYGPRYAIAEALHKAGYSDKAIAKHMRRPWFVIRDWRNPQRRAAASERSAARTPAEREERNLYQRLYYADHGRTMTPNEIARRKAQAAARWRAMTPEQREARNAKRRKKP